jgi:hypothetical protein
MVVNTGKVTCYKIFNPYWETLEDTIRYIASRGGKETPRISKSFTLKGSGKSV